MDMEEQISAAIDRVFTALEGREAKASQRFSEFETRITDMEKKSARHRAGGYPAAGTTWGSALTDSEGFKAMAGNRRGTARVEVQSAITTADDSGGGLIAPDKRTDPIMFVQRRPTVMDLIGSARTSSNAVTIVKQTTRTNSARFVSEGSTKPESTYAFEPQMIPVLTLAHWTAASVQALDDAPMLRGIIDGELRYGLQDVLETEILRGDGSSQHFEGLIPNALDFAAPFDVSMETYLDVLLQARAQLEAANYMATGVIVNPLDWSRMISAKASDGTYLSNGPFVATTPQLWGLPVAATTAMNEGDFLIGDFRRAATLFARQDATVEVSNEHSDFFTRNLVAVRAELRAAFAITDENAMVYGSFGSASSGA